MNFEQIKELINLVDSSKLEYFQIDTENEHIKMDKSSERSIENNTSNDFVKSELKTEKLDINNAKTINVSSKPQDAIVNEVKEDNVSIITSPMVGTFYSKASPESEEFAKAGDSIKKGSIVCIIEAMKLMNEIESEYSGIIEECLVKDGDMVEYGQPLFKVKEV